jgi:hypothetical protein
MRDFRDAKTMAHALRDALKAKTIEITHSESLELIANAFGYSNWNILAAKIEAAGRQAGEQKPTKPKALYCSFCGKSQHEVRKLIAGPAIFICDGCVELCVNIIREESALDKIVSPLWSEQIGDPTSAPVSELVRDLSSEELKDALERGQKGAERNRHILHIIERMLAMREGEALHRNDLLALPELTHLKNKSRDELLVLQQTAQVQLKRCEEGVRIATTMLAERGEQAG